MLTLTATATLLLQAAISERKRSVIEITNAQTAASLQSALVWAATELSSAPEKRIAFVDAATENYFYADSQIELELVLEGEKLDLNTAALSSIDDLIAEFLDPPKINLVSQITQDRVQNPIKLVDDLWQNVELSNVEKACLRKYFTVFGGQSDAVGNVEPTPLERTVSAGRSFQIRASAIVDGTAEQVQRLRKPQRIEQSLHILVDNQQ